MIKNIGVAVLGAVIVGAMFLMFAPTKTVETIKENMNLGAVSGNVITSHFLTVNGVRRDYRSQPVLTQGTTTVCSLRAPLDATSTLDSAIFKVATATDYTFYIAKAATNLATTTILRSQAITTDGQSAFEAASTTLANGTTLTQLYADRVFGPGQYLNFALNGAAEFRANGSCAAVFTVGAGN